MKNVHLIIISISLVLISCKSANKHLDVVQVVDIQKYSGKWYEIARLPNKFEKGLECVSANYTLIENGKIEVLNQGYSTHDHSKIETAKGKAYIPDKNEPAKLKVTFFWPFYGDYWIIYLDENYQYALVGDPSRKYLWILARRKTMEEITFQKVLGIARTKGFDVDKMEKIKQDCNN
jgi:apolipoprotein D and lipocalin family protein